MFSKTVWWIQPISFVTIMDRVFTQLEWWLGITNKKIFQNRSQPFHLTKGFQVFL